MAQELASKRLIWYSKDAVEAGYSWHCDDCGSSVKGREGYDRHVSCFPLHHLRAEVVLPASKSPNEGDAS
ncbi:MAG TPA: hypothetical protein VEC02_02715 [Nitrososphaerales archaeon]|nr:hypothetical protein [Nitrososphaerales archaeon]